MLPLSGSTKRTKHRYHTWTEPSVRCTSPPPPVGRGGCPPPPPPPAACCCRRRLLDPPPSGGGAAGSCLLLRSTWQPPGPGPCRPSCGRCSLKPAAKTAGLKRQSHEKLFKYLHSEVLIPYLVHRTSPLGSHHTYRPFLCTWEIQKERG